MLPASTEHTGRYAAISRFQPEGDPGQDQDRNLFKLFGNCCKQDTGKTQTLLS